MTTPTSSTPLKPPPVTSFSALVATLENGGLDDDLSQVMRELISKMRQVSGGHAKAAGKISLELSFGLDAGSMLTVTGEVKVKEPRLSRRKTVFWPNRENNLARTDPDAPELPLRDVSTPKMPPAHVANALA